MKGSSERLEQRGMAMLVALFTIVLLSVIGLGLMYSTNMETIINANYRDKQLAMYGAMSGVQEARDRLQPAAPKVVVPTDVPTLTNHQVIYIINPSGSETIAPWDATPGNKYMDTELCQEGILSLTPTSGPCTELPSGDEWYTVVDNTDTTYAPWNLSTPTDMKWTRILLKNNNSTPVPANGDNANSTQNCWDGKHQILKPDGYGPDCSPDGSIIKVTVTSGGTGYATNPTVTFSAPPAGGITAEGTAEIESVPSGQLSSITVVNPGAGYTTAPTVSFVGVGTGATATAEIVAPGSPVNSVTLTSPGEQCYMVPPPVSFTGGGSGATATATLEATPSCVAAWSVSGSCSARAGETVTGIQLAGGDGSGFSGSFRIASGGRGGPSVVSGTETIQNPGNGFTINPTSLANLPECPGLTVTAVAGYRLSSAMPLTSGGSGYTSVPTVNIGSGAGTAVAAATATATLGPAVAGGTVSAIQVNNPGTGYTVAPVVVLSGGGPGVTIPATAVANLALTNRVSSITLTNPGLGYRYNPTVTISSPPAGITATARASRANGSDWGKVYLVTSMSMTRSGAKAMAQSELASPVIGAWFPGALTLNGPDPNISALPNSNAFKTSGVDANTCSEDPEEVHPAVGGYDNPQADPPTNSVEDIIDAIPSGRANETYYEGTGGTPTSPSVVNIFGSLSETMSTPTGLKSFMDQIADDPDTHGYGNLPGSIAYGSAAVPTKDFVDGDLTLNGPVDGYGILAVTGKLLVQGNVHWHGIILVVGDGELEYQGGGVMEIYGTVFVAKIWDDHTTKNLLDALGSPTFEWNGGGGNGIYYDHCWVENLIPIVEFEPPPSPKPLKTLSTRTVTY
jgi:hypothetical protein